MQNDGAVLGADGTCARVALRSPVVLQAIVRVRDGKGVKHDGIKVEFVGSIGELIAPPRSPNLPLTRKRLLRSEHTELFYDRGNHYEFLSLVQELANPGEMRTAQAFDFEFKNVEKQYESYHGINVKLRCVNSLSMLTPRRMADPVASTGTLCA